jgi:acyl carrier protein
MNIPGFEVAGAVREVVAETLRLSPDAVALDAALEDGLGVDSMAMIEINVGLERRFGFAIRTSFAKPEEIGLRTVGDLVAFVEKLLRTAPAAGVKA